MTTLDRRGGALRGLWAMCATMCLVSAGLADEAPFYRGKRLTVLINFAASGPTDLEGRLFAKYLARHTAGEPGVVVQNMDGAGGLVGAQYLGEAAPRDGTMLGYLTGAAWRFSADPDKWRVDFRTYEFIASQTSTTIHFVRTDVPPGIKEATDIVKAKGLIAGGLSADASKDLRLRLGLDMLGVPYTYVTGYRSSPPARLAMQRGEIHMYSESPPAYRAVVEPTMVRTGEAIPIFVDDVVDGPATSPQLDGLPILTLPSLYKKVKGTLPSGPLWEAYRTIYETNATLTRIIALPPGAPKAAVEALRGAIEAMAHDRDFADECLTSIGFVPDYVAAPSRRDEIRRMLVVSQQVRAFIADYTREVARR